MNQTLLVNIAIILVVALGLIITHDPLFIMALLMLPQLPYGLVQEQMRMGLMSDDDEDEPQPMGFTQELKKR